MEKIKILMSYTGTEIHGQGVGAATIEQINLLEELCSNEFEIYRNKGKGDILHVHTIEPKGRRKAFRSKVPVVMHVHFLPETIKGSIKLPRPLLNLFFKYFLRLYRRANHIVVVNPIFIEPLGKYGIPAERITYIPNFVSEKTFYRETDEKRRELRKKYNIPEDKFVVLGVGQVQTRKGVLDFIKVAEKLPHIQFIWAGGFSFGAITDGHKDLKKVMDNPPANVRFIGIVPRPEMNDIYNIGDLLFMPSYNELFPMAILEACSSGLPLLLRALDLYEDILFKKYLRANDNDTFASIINELSSERAFYDSALTNSDYLKTYYSRENVAKLWRDFYKNVYEQQIVGRKHISKKINK